LEHSVEDAIYKSTRLGSAVPLSQFECLINGDLRGDLRPEQHFVCAEAQNVAVDRGHSIQPPILSDFGDHCVKSRLMLADPAYQPLSELAEFVVLQKPALNESANLVGGCAGILFDLVQDLERDFTAAGSSRHIQVISPIGAGVDLFKGIATDLL
jgi:hypothetical protein